MENELVNEVKQICRDTYNKLSQRHAELKGEGADVSILNEIVADMKETIRIYNEVNEENAEELKISATNLLNAVDDKYFEIDEEDVEETEVEEKKNNIAAIAFGLASTTLLAGIAVHTGIEAHRSRNNNSNTDIVDEPQETPSVVSNDEQNQSTDEKELVLGEYGTFFDVTNDEQVNARSQYIIDSYYSKFMNELSESEKSIITKENIANVIRVMAGELPLDENGNKVMDANIVDNYGQMFTVLVGDLGSSPQLAGRYYNVPAYMFTTDDSELSEFIKNYDESYQKITDGFNKAADERLEGKEVTGGKLVREGIRELGTKYWNEWVMQGIYGDTNPYNFDAKDRLFAYLSSFAKYGQYAFEYNLDSMQAVCVPVCVNYETKEINEIPVNEIFVGYASGEWDKVIAKAAGLEVQSEPDSIAFTQDLFDELNWKYNNLKQLKLNK